MTEKNYRIQKMIYIPQTDTETLPNLTRLAKAAGMSESEYIRHLIQMAAYAADDEAAEWAK